MGNLALNVPYLTHEHLMARCRELPASSATGGHRGPRSMPAPTATGVRQQPAMEVSPGNKQGGPGWVPETALLVRNSA